MTVSTEISRSEHGWTGAETSFSTGWPADAATDVKGVFVTAAGAESALSQGVHFSVALASGTRLVTCTPIAMPASSGTVVFYRSTPALVAEVLADGQNFPASVHQQLHNRAAMRDAELKTAAARSLQLSAAGVAYDIGNRRLANLAAGTAATDAMTVAQGQALQMADGNVPTPAGGDVNKMLVAQGAAAFSWQTLSAAMLPAAAVDTAHLKDKGVTLAKMADVGSGILLGRATAGAGAPEALTPAQARSVIGVASLVAAKSSAYTVVAADIGAVLSCTGTWTLSLTAAATLGNGFAVTVRNAGTGIITIDPNGSETVNGLTSAGLYPGEQIQLVCDGAGWLADFPALARIVPLTTIGAAVASVTLTFPAEFEQLEVVLDQFEPVSAAELGFRFIMSGTEQTANYAWQAYLHNNSPAGATYSQASALAWTTTAISLSCGNLSAAGSGYTSQTRVEVYPRNTGKFGAISYRSTQLNYSVTGGGRLGSTAADFTGCVIRFGGGNNIAAGGRYALFGRRM